MDKYELANKMAAVICHRPECQRGNCLVCEQHDRECDKYEYCLSLILAGYGDQENAISKYKDCAIDVYTDRFLKQERISIGEILSEAQERLYGRKNDA